MAQAAKKKVFDERYEILSIVGRGARSVVYHARHVKEPHTEVALKVLLEQKGKITNPERLRKEALALVSARHRHVIRLDDFHSVGSLCYLSLEYAPEADLRRYTARLGGTLLPDVGERFLLQVAEALAFVHKVGIIHRDVKPDNILVVNQNEVRLADFGVAVLPGDTASLEDLQSGVGTMNYLAPEVLDGKPADQRSDLYALAVTFYELLSGLNPFEKASLAQQIEARLDENVPRLKTLAPKIPEYLATTIMQAMSFDPEARFANVREFTQALLVNKANPPAEASSGGRSRQKTEPLFSLSDDLDSSDETSIFSDPLSSAPTSSLTKDISVNEDAGATDDGTRPMPKYEAPPTPVKQASEEVGQTVVVPSPVTQTVYAPGGMTKPNVLSTAPADVSATASVESVDETMSITPQSGASGSSITSSIGELSDPTQTVHIPQGSIDSAKKSGVEALRERSASRTSHKTNSTASHSPVQPAPRMNLRKVAMLGAGAGMALAMLVAGLLGVFSGTPSDDSLQASADFVPPIPPVASQDYTFPNLPAGMYVGSMSGLLPGKKIPLTIISIPRPALGEASAQQNSPATELSVVLGIDGWVPAVASIRGGAPAAGGQSPSPSILRATANGYILELAAQTVYGELYGTFRNLVTGAHGEWRARPVNPRRPAPAPQAAAS